MTRPNLIFIFSDQQRYSTMGCTGNTVIRTPAFDRLAAEGVLFSQAFSSCPICPPYRGQVLTGRYGHKNGVPDNEYALFPGPGDAGPDVESRGLSNRLCRQVAPGLRSLYGRKATGFRLHGSVQLPAQLFRRGVLGKRDRTDQDPTMGAGQQPDGFVHAWVINRAEKHEQIKPWGDLYHQHDGYVSGHLYEAAAAYFRATGKRNFLDVAVKSADQAWRHFIEQENPGFPGHAEIETALVELYRVTLPLSPAPVTLRMETDYPWNGAVKIAVEPAKDAEYAAP